MPPDTPLTPTTSRERTEWIMRRCFKQGWDNVPHLIALATEIRDAIERHAAQAVAAEKASILAELQAMHDGGNDWRARVWVHGVADCIEAIHARPAP